jgi:hypothetical protein
MFMNQPGDAVNNDSGFARTGAGKDQQRSGAMFYSLLLWRVEVFEQFHECPSFSFYEAEVSITHQRWGLSKS